MMSGRYSSWWRSVPRCSTAPPNRPHWTPALTCSDRSAVDEHLEAGDRAAGVVLAARARRGSRGATRPASPASLQLAEDPLAVLVHRCSPYPRRSRAGRASSRARLAHARPAAVEDLAGWAASGAGAASSTGRGHGRAWYTVSSLVLVGRHEWVRHRRRRTAPRARRGRSASGQRAPGWSGCAARRQPASRRPRGPGRRAPRPHGARRGSWPARPGGAQAGAQRGSRIIAGQADRIVLTRRCSRQVAGSAPAGRADVGRAPVRA